MSAAGMERSLWGAGSVCMGSSAPPDLLTLDVEEEINN